MSFSHHVCNAPAECGFLWDAAASGEAQLAAGDESICVIKVRGADCPPGTLAEDLQGAGGEAVDVHPAHQPHCALLTCRECGVKTVQIELRIQERALHRGQTGSAAVILQIRRAH